MDLFTYLMAKNGNNTSVHGDLFSYLLGKGQSQTQTISGVTIYIPDAKKLVSFMMTKESTQATTTGKNLFDKDNVTIINAYLIDGSVWAYSSDSRSFRFAIEPNTTYCISCNNTNETIFRAALTDRDNIPTQGNPISIHDQIRYTNTNTPIVLTTNSTDKYIVIQFSAAQVDTSIQTLQIELGSTATSYEPYTGGIPSPNPDYPQEVNTVKGYRNLFDKNDTAKILSAYMDGYEIVSYATNTTIYIPVELGKTYTVTKKYGSTRLSRATSNVLPNIGTSVSNFQQNLGNKFTYTIPNDANYLVIFVQGTADLNDGFTKEEILSGIQIVEGDQELPYVPYGNNYVNVAVNDGTNTNKYPIPLNNNEIVGIGDYKDELKVDKSGHVFINKKTGKVVYDGSENWIIETATHDGYTRFRYNNYSWLEPPLNNLRSTNAFCNNFQLGNTGSTTIGNILDVRTNGITMCNTNVASDLSNWTNWLSTHNIIAYYQLATEKTIDLQATVDLSLFKGVNNVSNSEDGYMTIEYH